MSWSLIRTKPLQKKRILARVSERITGVSDGPKNVLEYALTRLKPKQLAGFFSITSPPTSHLPSSRSQNKHPRPTRTFFILLLRQSHRISDYHYRVQLNAHQDQTGIIHQTPEHVFRSPSSRRPRYVKLGPLRRVAISCISYHSLMNPNNFDFC